MCVNSLGGGPDCEDRQEKGGGAAGATPGPQQPSVQSSVEVLRPVPPSPVSVPSSREVTITSLTLCPSCNNKLNLVCLE